MCDTQVTDGLLLYLCKGPSRRLSSLNVSDCGGITKKGRYEFVKNYKRLKRIDHNGILGMRDWPEHKSYKKFSRYNPHYAGRVTLCA